MSNAGDPMIDPAVSSYPVRFEVDYPESLSRWMLFVKWLLIIPHQIALAFLSFGLLVAIFLAWWAILFTGRYPRALFDFVVGVQGWTLRASAYASLLATDRYPPFSLGRPMTGTAILLVLLGALVFVSVVVLYTLAVISMVAPEGGPGPRGRF